MSENKRKLWSLVIETAEYPCALNKKITIIEMADDIVRDLGPLNRSDVVERINRLPIDIFPGRRLKEVNDTGLIVSNNGKDEKFKLPDAIVICVGSAPSPLPIQGKRLNVHCVGDCKRIGNAMDAIHDAFNTTRKL